MFVDNVECLPQPEVAIVRAAETDLVDGLAQVVLEPLQSMRERFVAIAGVGLDNPDLEGTAVRRRWTAAAGGAPPVSYLAAGDPRGAGVLFIHGSPGLSEEWGNFLVDVPAGQYRLAPDRPGFGDTSPEIAVTSLAAQAAALSPLLAPADAGGTILVGYSYGGPVALRMAADYPDRVAGLLLIGSAADPGQEDVNPLQRLAAMDIFEQLLPDELAHSNEELLALKPELDDLAGSIGKITAPVTVLQGLDDTLVPPENASYLQAKLTGPARPRVFLFEGADHFMPWTHIDQINRALDCVIADANARRSADQP